MAQTILFRNLKAILQTHEQQPALLKGAAMQHLPQIEDAFLLVQGEQILDFGPMSRCPERADQILDGTGRYLLPTWCDSHTHLVYAASREEEFVDKIKGLSYEEIARKGGGILNSARKLQAMPEEQLLQQAYVRLQEVQGFGTGALEIKSGYGLSVESELKMLRVIAQLRQLTKMPIRATFLGAHAFPMEYRQDRQGYIRLVVEEMLPQVAEAGLADFCDVFCEEGFFSEQESEYILEAAQKLGIRPKVHANELALSGGVQVGTRLNALSVDHLECIGEAELQALEASSTIATLLPSTAFFLRLPYAPARELLQRPIALALASDYNPGTTPSGKMPFVLSLACIQMRMLPEEALNAMTINGAYAMDLAAQVGWIGKGQLANLILTKPIPSIAFMPYAFGSDWIEGVWIAGERQK